MRAVAGEQQPDAAALAGLLPELVRIARGELHLRHLDVQLAEDVVEDAVERWLTARIQYASPRQARSWFKTVIRRMTVDRVRRPSRDVLDQAGLYSLDEP